MRCARRPDRAHVRPCPLSRVVPRATLGRLVELEIDPLVGVGPFRFGMTPGEVRRLGLPDLQTLRKADGVPHETDAFGGMLHVCYPNGRVQIVEVSEPHQATLDGVPLIGTPFGEACEFILARDPDARPRATVFESVALGLGIHYRHYDEGAPAPQRVTSVSVCARRPYEDGPASRAKLR